MAYLLAVIYDMFHEFVSDTLTENRMYRLRGWQAWLVVSVLFCGTAALGQENMPRLGYAFPAGGQRNTSFHVTVGGQYFNDIGRITVSGSGVEAKLAEGIKPLTDVEVKAMRDRLALLGKDQKDPATRREMAEIQRKLARHMAAQQRRQTQPAISETAEVEVTISADAEIGVRELRLESARGVSNPLRFFVGNLPEFREQEPELVTEFQDFNTPTRYPATVTTNITVPATANGQIIPREPDALRFGIGFTPGDADRYRFEAKKGQTLVIAAAARQLIPYLPDAVPGWFQATLTLFDDRGREIAFQDDYRFQPDPVLVFKVPADGFYVVEIKDAIYRGRPDFVYRITIGEIPFLTSIFPLGGRVDEQTGVQLSGQNLPQQEATFDGRNKSPGGYSITASQGSSISNALPFAIDNLPECLEKEPNESSEASAVTLPLIVNGRIDKPGDVDVFRFEGKAGQQIIAEVAARRLGSPVDSALELTDAAGKRLVFNDDHEDKGDALNTHQADSMISFVLPADGVYFIRLNDAQHQGGQEYAYRLRLSQPMPDFALRIVPSCINASSWRLTPVTVFALRKDGFDGDISLSIKDCPEGVILTGAQIPAGQDQVRITLSTAGWAAIEPIALVLEGRAFIGGNAVVHAAVASDSMMQAFAYKHLVPAEQLRLVVADAGRFRAGANLPKRPPDGRRNYQSPTSIESDTPTRIPIGGTVEVKVRGNWSNRQSDTLFELSDPPAGIAIDKFAWQDRSLVLTFRADTEKARPGSRGNLIVNIFQKRTDTNREGKTREFRAFNGPLPAIPFEIIKP